MNPEVVASIVAVGGALSGALIAYAALGNMRNGRAGNMLQAATFLQSEVVRLQKDNEELRKENEKLKAQAAHKRIAGSTHDDSAS